MVTLKRLGTRRRRAGRPGAGQAPLSRERILRTALRLVDEQGLAALTMRRLAAELGVNPMSIYHHLPGKAALVSGLVAIVFAELRLSRRAAWQERVRDYAQAYRRLARTHPHLVLAIVADAAAVSTAILAAGEPLYQALAAAGLSPLMTVRAADAVVDFVHGFVLGEAANPSGQWEIVDELRRRLDTLPPEDVPTMRRVFDALAAAGLGYDFDAGFEAGLDVLVRGIESLASGDGATGDAGHHGPPEKTGSGVQDEAARD